ncbi:hypothetical protein GEV29_01845 [Aeromicrobium sp. SMF47]|uniref:Uncharacterized protein n=1 Tax=Aeromicrobium yanjiei TaxID=2662028 RepID=A0A5Q2MJZ7_9ACTN|nr:MULTISPECIES: hypothetical protein [Aeromicrobium]MRJ75271.1 hypothetical protein [Aeromicrobium yanjiei]MRK02671.1 hypothetical protein [Aeromicrobium sp. S22]QGG40270.1 hypothetical protein GEV26_02160 [Aeromicrobium yanjiei]
MTVLPDEPFEPDDVDPEDPFAVEPDAEPELPPDPDRIVPIPGEDPADLT